MSEYIDLLKIGSRYLTNDEKGIILDYIDNQDKEIERLNNTINEVREYIEENMGYYSERLEYKEYTERYIKDLKKIMNLLDKGE